MVGVSNTYLNNENILGERGEKREREKRGERGERGEREREREGGQQCYMNRES